MGALLHRAVSGEPGVEANVMTAARLACNCFRHAPTRAWLASNLGPLLDLFGGSYGSGNKNVRLSIATLLLNLAVMARSGAGTAPVSADAKVQMLSALSELLGSVPAEDVDSAQRALLAFGTLLLGDKELCDLARDLGANEIVRAFANRPVEKLKELASEIGIVVTQ